MLMTKFSSTLLIAGAIAISAPVAQAQSVGADAQTGSQGGSFECSNASLRGSFGYTSVGNLLETGGFPPAVVGPFAEVGRQTFNGRGATQGTATLSANGNILGVTFKGTYEVKANCTGSMTFLVDPLGPPDVTADFVIDDDGAELRVIITGAGVVESRIYRKQFSGSRNQ
jgi:hypothetical protein